MARSSGSLRAQTTTSAPSERNRSAVTLPRPLVPPVISTTCPDLSMPALMDRNLEAGPSAAARARVSHDGRREREPVLVASAGIGQDDGHGAARRAQGPGREGVE